MSNFPTSLDDSSSIPNPATTDKTNSPSHADLHGATGDAVKAIQAKVGIGATTPVANSLLFGTGTGTSRWGTITSAELSATVTNETGTGSLVFGTAPTLSLPKVDTIEESTPANGVTVDGMSIKDGKLNTNNAVVTSSITDDAVTTPKVPDGAITASKLATSAITQGYAQATSNFTTTAVLTDTNVTSLSVTVTVPSGGRRCKITAYTPAYSATAAGTKAVIMGIRESTTVLSNANYDVSVGQSGFGIPATCMYSAVLTAGSHTYDVFVRQTAAGTITLTGSATAPAFILVEAI